MNITSKIIITLDFEKKIQEFEEIYNSCEIVKIVTDEFLIDDTKLAISKAYTTSNNPKIIILGAKKFSKISQNKLLKILEEPPLNVYFILLTISKTTLLPTIKSRLPIIKEKVILEKEFHYKVDRLNLEMVYDILQTYKNDTKNIKNFIEIFLAKTLQSPKFKFKKQDLDNKYLQSMGMKTAFSGIADFSGINGKKDLFISSVYHKAFIEVNEEGSEAAAATAVVVDLGVAISDSEFNANHPFLFIIRDNTTGTILFIGRITNPL